MILINIRQIFNYMNNSSHYKSYDTLYSNNNMMYVGKEQHKNNIQIIVMDEKVKVVKNNKITKYIIIYKRKKYFLTL